MFQTKVVEKLETHILYAITFSLKSCCVWDDVEKYGTAWQTRPQYNMVQHAAWLDVWGYRYKLRICNTYSFSKATMVTGTSLQVTIYVHHLLLHSRRIVHHTSSDRDSRPSLYRFMHYSRINLYR